jgi:hypothetical protein
MVDDGQRQIIFEFKRKKSFGMRLFEASVTVWNFLRYRADALIMNHNILPISPRRMS